MSIVLAVGTLNLCSCALLYTRAFWSAHKHSMSRRRKFSMSFRHSVLHDYAAEVKTTTIGFVTFVTVCSYYIHYY